MYKYLRGHLVDKNAVHWTRQLQFFKDLIQASVKNKGMMGKWEEKTQSMTTSEWIMEEKGTSRVTSVQEKKTSFLQAKITCSQTRLQIRENYHGLWRTDCFVVFLQKSRIYRTGALLPKGCHSYESWHEFPIIQWYINSSGKKKWDSFSLSVVYKLLFNQVNAFRLPLLSGLPNKQRFHPSENQKLRNAGRLYQVMAFPEWANSRCTACAENTKTAMSRQQGQTQASTS